MGAESGFLLRKQRQDIKHRKLKFASYSICKDISNKLICCVLVAVLTYISSQLPVTKALFTDQEVSENNTFTAATFDGAVQLLPGDSKTNDSPRKGGPAFYVAQAVNGKIHLDFGTYPVGNNRNFPSVLRIINISDRDLNIGWQFCSNIEAFFEAAQGFIVLAPTEEYILGFKLNTNPKGISGEFVGSLRILAIGYSTDLPLRLNIVEKRGRDGGVKDDKDEYAKDDEYGKDDGEKGRDTGDCVDKKEQSVETENETTCEKTSVEGEAPVEAELPLEVDGDPAAPASEEADKTDDEINGKEAEPKEITETEVGAAVEESIAEETESEDKDNEMPAQAAGTNCATEYKNENDEQGVIEESTSTEADNKGIESLPEEKAPAEEKVTTEISDDPQPISSENRELSDTNEESLNDDTTQPVENDSAHLTDTYSSDRRTN